MSSIKTFFCLRWDGISPLFLCGDLAILAGAGASIPSTAMLVYTLIYIAVMMGCTFRFFAQRDL